MRMQEDKKPSTLGAGKTRRQVLKGAAGLAALTLPGTSEVRPEADIKTRIADALKETGISAFSGIKLEEFDPARPYIFIQSDRKEDEQGEGYETTREFFAKLVTIGDVMQRLGRVEEDNGIIIFNPETGELRYRIDHRKAHPMTWGSREGLLIAITEAPTPMKEAGYICVTYLRKDTFEIPLQIFIGNHSRKKVIGKDGKEKPMPFAWAAGQEKDNPFRRTREK